MGAWGAYSQWVLIIPIIRYQIQYMCTAVVLGEFGLETTVLC